MTLVAEDDFDFYLEGRQPTRGSDEANFQYQRNRVEGDPTDLP